MRFSPTHPSPPLLVLGASSLIGRALARVAPKLNAYWLSRSTGETPGWITAELASPSLAQDLSAIAPLSTVLALTPIWITAPAVPTLAALGAKRILAISSTSRFTKAASPDAAERAVAQRLASSEAQFFAACTEHGIAYTLFRPTLIYDEGFDRNISRLAAVIRRARVAPLSGDGRGRRQPVHAEDLALGALQALADARTEGQVYATPGGEILTYRQMVERLFEGLGLQPKIIAFPSWLWRLAFLLAKPVLPGTTAAMGARMAEDLVFDDEAARRDFGWSPRPFRPTFPGGTVAPDRRHRSPPQAK